MLSAHAQSNLLLQLLLTVPAALMLLVLLRGTREIACQKKKPGGMHRDLVAGVVTAE
jgi:hypothetical protein